MRLVQRHEFKGKGNTCYLCGLQWWSSSHYWESETTTCTRPVYVAIDENRNEISSNKIVDI